MDERKTLKFRLRKLIDPNGLYHPEGPRRTGHEAADEIEHLEADLSEARAEVEEMQGNFHEMTRWMNLEFARLRAALESLRDNPPLSPEDVREIAARALNHDSEDSNG